MTETRITPRGRLHLLTILAAAGLLGVLVGLAIVGSDAIPGVVEPGEVIRVGLPIVRVLLDVAAITTVGLSLLPILIGFDRPAKAESVLAGTRRIALASSLVWAVSALVALVLQTAEVHPGTEVSLSEVGTYVGEFGAGKALLAVAVFAMVSAGLNLWAVHVGEAVPAELRTAVALFTMLPLPVTGHATNWQWHDFTMISMELHVMGAVAWTGGLGATVALLAVNRNLLAAALPRFSKLATVCLVVVAASGLFNAVVELTVTPGQTLFGGLFGTSYGWLVVGKIVFLLVLAATGGKIRWRLLPLIVKHKTTALFGWAALELAVMGLAFGFAVVLTRAPVT